LRSFLEEFEDVLSDEILKKDSCSLRRLTSGKKNIEKAHQF